MNNETDYKGNKACRILHIYRRLSRGEYVTKEVLAEEYGVTPKTIQRDMQTLRDYLSYANNADYTPTIKHVTRKGYHLTMPDRSWITNQEVLALCKILLESRAFVKDELNTLLDRLVEQVVPVDRKLVRQTICNEQSGYVELRHGQPLMEPIWQLSQHIFDSHIINFDYVRQDGVRKNRTVKPMTVLFSEYYFYLVAFTCDDERNFPISLRVDRISNLKDTGNLFERSKLTTFNEKEFRKRIYYMYGGELQRIGFEFRGDSIEAILDKIPTAQVTGRTDDGGYIVTAEGYGDGIHMWLQSQGNWVSNFTSERIF